MDGLEGDHERDGDDGWLAGYSGRPLNRVEYVLSDGVSRADVGAIPI